MKSKHSIFLRALAWFVTRPAVFEWLKHRAIHNPYTPITNGDNTKIYMWRGWIFNRYDREGGPRFKFLRSVRLHHIRLPDEDRHMHDHPWDAITIGLDGWYWQKIPNGPVPGSTRVTTLNKGDIAYIRVGQYHLIEKVSKGGVWTLFITGKYNDTWGFLVNGKKVWYKDYIKAREMAYQLVQEGTLREENVHVWVEWYFEGGMFSDSFKQ